MREPIFTDQQETLKAIAVDKNGGLSIIKGLGKAVEQLADALAELSELDR